MYLERFGNWLPLRAVNNLHLRGQMLIQINYDSTPVHKVFFYYRNLPLPALNNHFRIEYSGTTI